MANKFHKKIDFKDKIYGTATIGVKGQVVIPAQARKDLKLKAGDQLIVMGKLDKVVALMKADQIEDLVATIMDSFDGTITKKEVQQQAQDFLKLLKQNKH